MPLKTADGLVHVERYWFNMIASLSILGLIILMNFWRHGPNERAVFDQQTQTIVYVTVTNSLTNRP